MLLGGVSLQPGGARSRLGAGANEPAGAGEKHESQTIHELKNRPFRFEEGRFLHRGEQAPPRCRRKNIVGRYCVGRDRSRPVPTGETRNRRLPSFQWRTRLRRKKGRVACIGLLKEPHPMPSSRVGALARTVSRDERNPSFFNRARLPAPTACPSIRRLRRLLRVRKIGSGLEPVLSFDEDGR